MIKIENLYINFPGFSLKDINLSIEKGEFFVLLGPTGAGKTVLLETIVGLVPVKKGRIYIEGVDVTKEPPEKRRIGIVYQDCALFPHLTVLKNIKYGLHFNKQGSSESLKRLHRLVEQLRLHSILQRLPVNLSGGEMKRVALARALVINPSILLLDEPLSALDPNFKEEIREELKRIHQKTGITFFMVTHDFTDVLYLATKAAVMNEGKIEQVGDVTDIFQRPSSSFVANFLGAKNIFRGNMIKKDDRTFVDTGGAVIEVASNLRKIEGRVYFTVRPEDIIISQRPFSSSARNCYPGKVVEVINRGEVFYVTADIGERMTALITKASFEEMDLREGDRVFLSFKATAVHLFI